MATGLTFSARLTNSGKLTKLEENVFAFASAVNSAAKAAADGATAASRSKVKHVRPIVRDGRPGRNYEPIADVLRWKVTPSGQVLLNVKELDQRARHWIIQQAGTDSTAVFKQGGDANPVGRPAAGARYIRKVKSQEGRRIRAGLVFADQAGNFVPTGQGHGQQLWLRSKVKGGPWITTRSQPGIIIRKEIAPQRFVQAGAKEGFREYRRSVLTAARTAFGNPG